MLYFNVYDVRIIIKPETKVGTYNTNVQWQYHVDSKLYKNKNPFGLSFSTLPSNFTKSYLEIGIT